jgi:hypothetical protein
MQGGEARDPEQGAAGEAGRDGQPLRRAPADTTAGVSVRVGARPRSRIAVTARVAAGSAAAASSVALHSNRLLDSVLEKAPSPSPLYHARITSHCPGLPMDRITLLTKASARAGLGQHGPKAGGSGRGTTEGAAAHTPPPLSRP